jgi:hypothetical protein
MSPACLNGGLNGKIKMQPPLPTDDDTNRLFDRTVSELEAIYSRDQAEAMTREYYSLFRDPGYCASIHVRVQDDDFFHHQGPADMALRVHYYLGLKGDPDPHRFLEWRSRLYSNAQQKSG